MTGILLSSLSPNLADSGLKTRWLVETLLKHNSEFKSALGGGKVKEVTAKDISEGEGYASKVYRVVTHFDSSNVDKYSLIMKVPTKERLQQFADSVEGELREACEESLKGIENLDIMDLHEIECAFFEAVKDVEGFPMPKVWYTRRNSKDELGVILMEDLGTAGCKNGLAKAFTVEQIRNITRHFAALHACHICADDAVLAAIDAIPKKTDWIEEAGEKSLPTLEATVPECREGGCFKEHLDKLKPTFTKKFSRFVITERPKQLGIPPLLCQGDSGEHNMFFKKASDGTATNEVCAFIDWQIEFQGNPFYDIAKFTMAFTDAEVRREVDANLAEDYFEHLKNGVEKKSRALQFGVKELREAYELAKIHHVLTSVGWLAFLAFIFKDKDPGVMEALREKLVLRARFALVDATESLRKYAPEYLAE